MLEFFPSGVCIVSAPGIVRLLKLFSRSSFCGFIKYVRVRQVLKGHPNVTVRLGAAHGRECSFNCHQYSSQQRFLHDGCREGGICRLKSTRRYERFCLLATPPKQAMRSIASVKPVALICFTSSAFGLMRSFLLHRDGRSEPLNQAEEARVETPCVRASQCAPLGSIC